MGDREDFKNTIAASLFLAFVGIPLLVAVVKGSELELPLMVVLWLVPAVVFAGSIVTDAESNLISIGSFLGWIVANAIIVKVTGDWIGVVLTIIVMIILICIKNKSRD